MKGSYEVIVRNRRLQFKFKIQRNITVLRGDSATGKTTVIDMIATYHRLGRDSGVEVLCEKECVVITGERWRENLQSIHDSIVFIDEGDKFVTELAFAEAIKNTDNYYVIATRSSLFNLPYSVKEIYGIRNVSGNRYQGTKRLYSEFYPINNLEINKIPTPDIILVEDSHSGYEFYQSAFSKYGIECISAGGNSNIYKKLIQLDAKVILVIADGAAFGAEIERVLQLKRAKNFVLYLPESFEWNILSSGVVPNVRDELEHTADYVDSAEHFSWEKFFTALLIAKTEGTYLKYSKDKLNPVYLHDNESSKIMSTMPKLIEK